jgi:hypothetical protein
MAQALAMVYDLRDAEAWRLAHEHRRLWGHSYTDCHVLDSDHIVIEFHPRGGHWSASENKCLFRALKGSEVA